MENKDSVYKKVSTKFGIIGFILAIVSLFLGPLALVLGVIALILSIIQIIKSKTGLAIAGGVISIIAILIGLVSLSLFALISVNLANVEKEFIENDDCIKLVSFEVRSACEMENGLLKVILDYGPDYSSDEVIFSGNAQSVKIIPSSSISFEEFVLNISLVPEMSQERLKVVSTVNDMECSMKKISKITFC